MIQIECPWCSAPAEFTTAESSAVAAPLEVVECAACDIRVDVAPDPAHAGELARAA
jgi:sarcosine oxidase delta subunit